MGEIEKLKSENKRLKQEIEELKSKIKIANDMNSESFHQMIELNKTISYYEDAIKVQRYKPWD